jgi:ubiquinone/menaquinone biosynthesis C-methylase UbiE
MITKYPLNFARFYDTIYHQMRDGVDNNFFLDEALKSKGRVLEVGTGTGRLFMNALKGGADIYGLDISESMLDVLYKKLPEDQHYRLSLQNVVDFSFDFKFDTVMAPFRVLMHLIDKSEQLKALNNVCRHMNDGGTFIFDAFVPDLIMLVNGVHNQMDFEGEYEPGRLVRRFVTTEPDLIHQTILVNFHMEWQEGGGWKQDDWSVPLRFFFRYELEHLIERSDFREYTIYGDYSGSRLDKNSREFVVVCRK